MATIYKTNGDVIKISPKNGTDFKLEELQKIVNGCIEIIPLNKGRIMVMNEDGKNKCLAINKEATRIFRSVYSLFFDVIVGNVLICDGKQVL